MGQDVVVRRCELTVRGRGGWGWGTDAERYVRASLPSIELALERIVAEAGLPDDADVRLTEPVTLTWRPDRTLDDAARHEVVAALRAAVAGAPAETAGSSAAARTAPRGHDGPDIEPPAVTRAGERLARLVGAWSRAGRLPRLVAGWPEATAARWCALLTSAEEGVELAAEAVESVAAAVLAQATRPGEPAVGAARRTLTVLGALVAAAGDRPVGPATARAARLAGAGAEAAAAPVEETTAASTERRPLDVPPGVVASEASTNATTPARSPHPSAAVEVPGLPFLVLVQLSRLGYLDALAAVAATSRDPEGTTRLLVGAVAGKVLPAPGRGWSRSVAEGGAVEAAAGWSLRDQDAASRSIGDETALLAAPLASAVVQSYADPAAADLEVTGSDGGWVIGEVAGSLPLAWVEGPEEADAVLAALGRAPARRSERFRGLVDRLGPRRAFPGVEQEGLERVVGAAVGTALGSLALELWGPVDDAPLRALERLEDLEVEVRPGDGQGLTIAVPRGQIWLDLVAAALMNRWPMPVPSSGESHSWELVTW